jgi:hypothetical protein
MTLALTLLTLLHLAAAAYAQQHLPRYIAGARRAALLRAVLVVTGLAVGSVATIYAAQPSVAILAFLSGFGAVHVPAAIILLVKRARGAAPS